MQSNTAKNLENLENLEDCEKILKDVLHKQISQQAIKLYTSEINFINEFDRLIEVGAPMSNRKIILTKMSELKNQAKKELFKLIEVINLNN